MHDLAEKKEKLDSLEADKAQMIARYMSLQDKADAVNEEIYKVCCGVEALNAQIEALKAEMRKAALKPAAPNGKSHPPSNGGSHSK
jgi:hypothetical protein